MERTLLAGDHLIMSRVGYDAGVPFTNWACVVLAQSQAPANRDLSGRPTHPISTDLVKRVIGLPGDSIDLRNGSVFVNGKKLEEAYAVGKTEPNSAGYEPHSQPALTFPYQVPQNCYFAMGDNRGNSYDSRFWGCVPREDIIGTPVMIYMSLDANADALRSWLNRRTRHGLRQRPAAPRQRPLEAPAQHFLTVCCLVSRGRCGARRARWRGAMDLVPANARRRALVPAGRRWRTPSSAFPSRPFFRACSE